MRKLLNTAAACVLSAGLLGGCGSMSPTLDKERTHAAAEYMAFSVACINAGLIEASVGYPPMWATNDLLKAVSYDKDTYESAYKTTLNKLENTEKVLYSAACNKISRESASATKNIRDDIARLANKKESAQLDYSGLTRSMDDLNNNIRSNSNFNAPMPSGQVTFGIQENQTKHYLIQTPNGQSQCSVSPSGYVRCN